MRFGVITKVCDPASGGNLVTAAGQVFLDPQAKGGSLGDPHLPLGEGLGNPMLELYVQVPLFQVGELLVLDDDDRDQMGRKPSKWDVTCEEFDNVEEAVARARHAYEADGGAKVDDQEGVGNG